VKQGFRSHCAIAALVLVFGAFTYAVGQTPSATPDPFVVQLTSSPAGFSAFAGDITANGRFVVFESNGNVATESPRNADGNREIFLADYAQRRIFQLTNTKNIQKPQPTPTPTPSPAPSPTPTPSPTPADPSQIQIEISNNRPMITFEPPLNGGGQRVFTIVFSSNSPTLPNFDGTSPGASFDADANQEIWIYQLPGVTDLSLTSGDDVAFQDLAGGTFTQITSTPASRVPTPGGASGSGVLPFVADDNREATINDDGTVIAFISTRNLVPGVGNTDANPELFLWTSSGFTQGTNTQDAMSGPTIISRFQQNPSLSANGSVVAFLSSANLTGQNADDSNGSGNGEVFVADFGGSGLSNIRQVTRTKNPTGAGATVNLLSPGRRLSRDGALIALESLTTDPKANVAPTLTSYAVFVYNIAGDTFAQASPRVATTSEFGFIHFPTFTDYNSSLAPSTLVFASALNFKSDGTFPAAADTSTGLNPLNQPQLFSTQVPATSSNTFSRLTKNPVGGFGGIRPLASQTRTRIAFSLAGSELGGGNADGSSEVFYLLIPAATSESSAVLSFFTGASNFPVVAATPSASPTPAPTPSPTPGTIAVGLAPGELSFVRSTVALAPGDKIGAGGSEIARSPILPVELNGVSVSVNSAAAGLYFVGDSPAEGITFVVPIGVAEGLADVVVNNNGTVFRGLLRIVGAQPDIFTSTNDAGGTAVVCNITNTAVSGCVMGPFNVTTPDSTGTAVPTVLEIHLTGVRNAVVAETKATIGTTDINAGSVRRNINMFGEDLITITLPASLAGAGDVPLIVTVTKTGGIFTSRGAATAPHIVIN
jgi:hypothetical protein